RRRPAAPRRRGGTGRARAGGAGRVGGPPGGAGARDRRAVPAGRGVAGALPGLPGGRVSGTSAVGDASEAVSEWQTAYGFLRERIAGRELSPGYRLVLQSIADELDMSVVPVREAIRRLEAEGLVTYERNVGARVAMIDEHGYVDAMQALGVVEGA